MGTVSPSTVHKVYAGAIALVVVLAVIVGSAWSAHVKDEAKRDAVIDAQNTLQNQQKQTIADLQKQIEAGKAATAAQIGDLQKQKAQVIAQPSQIPDAFFQLLKQVVPNAAPIQQTAKVDDKKPDAPSAVLTNQNQIDLVNAAYACKQCFLEKQQLADQVVQQAQIIGGKDSQLSSKQLQLDAAMKAAKGGSVWQRTKTILKWGAIFGGVGYVAGRSQR